MTLQGGKVPIFEAGLIRFYFRWMRENVLVGNCWEPILPQSFGPGTWSTLQGHLRELIGEGVDHELETIRDAELRIDRAEMVSDSGRADEESFGNLFIL